MNEQTNNSNAAFMEVTSRKMEVQDKKMSILEEKLRAFPDNTELIQKLQTRIDELRVDVKASMFPLDKIADFSSRLDFGIACISHPIENKVLHHHHVHKLVWITLGLFIALSLVCAGWYNTVKKLDNYIANDTKYRYLRLDIAKSSLQFYLDATDSLYNTHTNMRKYVLETEEKYRQNIERLLKAEQLKAEAKDLEKSAKEK